jgi:hypothetical protein
LLHEQLPPEELRLFRRGSGSMPESSRARLARHVLARHGRRNCRNRMTHYPRAHRGG